MNINSNNKVSVLLVCPPGLEQASLYTTVSAFTQATVIAKAAGTESAWRIVQQNSPDVLLVDANLLQDEISHLLRSTKELSPGLIRVVLMNASKQRRRLQEEGADFILDYSDLAQQFPQILRGVQVKNQDGSSS